MHLRRTTYTEEAQPYQDDDAAPRPIITPGDGSVDSARVFRDLVYPATTAA
jgi:hypothetical protein